MDQTFDGLRQTASPARDEAKTALQIDASVCRSSVDSRPAELLRARDKQTSARNAASASAPPNT